MPRSGPRKIQKHSTEFTVTAVKLSQQPGLQVQVVAAALEIHPFMLSKWRKDFREGRLRGQSRFVAPPVLRRESRRLQQLEREHALLQTEHALLTKAIRFCSEPSVKRSRSSTRNAPRSPLQRIQEVFRAHRGMYGSPRIVRALRDAGIAISRRRVMRLMRLAGLRARAARVYRGNPKLHQFFSQHPNRIRRLPVRRPNRVWVGDRRESPTRVTRLLPVLQRSSPALGVGLPSSR